MAQSRLPYMHLCWHLPSAPASKNPTPFQSLTSEPQGPTPHFSSAAVAVVLPQGFDLAPNPILRLFSLNPEPSFQLHIHVTKPRYPGPQVSSTHTLPKTPISSLFNPEPTSFIIIVVSRVHVHVSMHVINCPGTLLLLLRLRSLRYERGSKRGAESGPKTRTKGRPEGRPARRPRPPATCKHCAHTEAQPGT